MTDASAPPPRAAQRTSSPMTAPRRRTRHHEAVIEAEVRRLARTQTESLVKADARDLYGGPEELPAA
jgi:hypothetical protein